MATQDDRPPKWWNKYKETEMYKTNEALSHDQRKAKGLLREYDEDEVPKDMAGTLVSFRLKPGTTEKGFQVAWDRLVEESPELDCLVPELEAPPSEDWGPKGIHPHEATLDELPSTSSLREFYKECDAALGVKLRIRSSPAPEEADGPESRASQCPEDPSDRDTSRECSCLLLCSLLKRLDPVVLDQFLALVRRVLPLVSQSSGPSLLWRALGEAFAELALCGKSDASSGPSLCPSGSPEEGTQTSHGTPERPPGPSRDHSRDERLDSLSDTPESDPSDGPSSGGPPAQP